MSDRPAPLDLLLRGELTIKGRMPWSSNGTYLAAADARGESVDAVYKPRRGERPLWDFPDGLFKREVAAYELSEALGWDIVPLTVLRSEGPLGEGSLQLFVPADFEQHYFTLYEDEQHHDRLRTICAFDLLANNTDRKSGHCLLGEDGQIYAIDNGLSFHHEFKLRTVIWEFGGEPIPAGHRRRRRPPARRRASPHPWSDCSTPSSATPCSPGPGPSSATAASPSTTAAAATPGPSSDPP